MKIISVSKEQSVDVDEIVIRLNMEDEESFIDELKDLLSKYKDELKDIKEDLKEEYYKKSRDIADKYDIDPSDLSKNFEAITCQLMED